MEVEARVEEEIPVICDYCQKPKPEFYCVICDYSFHADCRHLHRHDCSSKLRGEMDWVECSVEDCLEAVPDFYRCPVCKRWFCHEHIDLHIEEELDKAERKIEEG